MGICEMRTQSYTKSRTLHKVTLIRYVRSVGSAGSAFYRYPVKIVKMPINGDQCQSISERYFGSMPQFWSVLTLWINRGSPAEYHTLGNGPANGALTHPNAVNSVSSQINTCKCCFCMAPKEAMFYQPSQPSQKSETSLTHKPMLSWDPTSAGFSFIWCDV